ncbi:MAG: hypothetical protein COA94_01345 [Rickettsiales bacterium]|nr:MAG: hypothetical protein COA94_01345 [Rickettsiales bacterium]
MSTLSFSTEYVHGSYEETKVPSGDACGSNQLPQLEWPLPLTSGLSLSITDQEWSELNLLAANQRWEQLKAALEEKGRAEKMFPKWIKVLTILLNRTYLQKDLDEGLNALVAQRDYQQIDIELIKQLASMGSDVNYTFRGQIPDSALQIAVRSGNVSLIKTLLESGEERAVVKLNKYNENNKNEHILYSAIQLGDLELVIYLLQYNILDSCQIACRKDYDKDTLVDCAILSDLEKALQIIPRLFAAGYSFGSVENLMQHGELDYLDSKILLDLLKWGLSVDDGVKYGMTLFLEDRDEGYDPKPFRMYAIKMLQFFLGKGGKIPEELSASLDERLQKLVKIAKIADDLYSGNPLSAPLSLEDIELKLKLKEATEALFQVLALPEDTDQTQALDLARALRGQDLGSFTRNIDLTNTGRVLDLDLAIALRGQDLGSFTRNIDQTQALDLTNTGRALDLRQMEKAVKTIAKTIAKTLALARVLKYTDETLEYTDETLEYTAKALKYADRALKDADRALKDAYRVLALKDAYRVLALKDAHRALEDAYRALEDVYQALEYTDRAKALKYAAKDLQYAVLALVLKDADQALVIKCVDQALDAALALKESDSKLIVPRLLRLWSRDGQSEYPTFDEFINWCEGQSLQLIFGGLPLTLRNAQSDLMFLEDWIIQKLVTGQTNSMPLIVSLQNCKNSAEPVLDRRIINKYIEIFPTLEPLIEQCIQTGVLTYSSLSMEQPNDSVGSKRLREEVPHQRVVRRKLNPDDGSLVNQSPVEEMLEILQRGIGSYLVSNKPEVLATLSMHQEARTLLDKVVNNCLPCNLKTAILDLWCDLQKAIYSPSADTLEWAGSKIQESQYENAGLKDENARLQGENARLQERLKALLEPQLDDVHMHEAPDLIGSSDTPEAPDFL